MKKLPTELVSQVIELRKANVPFSEIAARLNVSKNTVEHAARMSGATKRRLGTAEREEIRTKRLAGVLAKDLAEEYGVSRVTIFETTKDLDLSHLNANKEQVIADYKAGMPHKDIGLKHGLATRSVASLLRNAGAQEKNLSAEERANLIADRKAGVTRQELAAKYGMTEAGIKSILYANGVVLDRKLLINNTIKGRIDAYLANQGVKNHDELMVKYADKHKGKYLGGYTDSSESANWACSKGHEFSMRPNSVQQGQWCPRCAFVGPSKGQLEVKEYIESLGFVAYAGNRDKLISPVSGKALEIDVWVPGKNLAIEFDGLIWHSEKFSEPNKHKTKAMAARSAGVRLFAFFEDEWEHKQNLIKAMIRRRLGYLGANIRASKLEIRKLSKNSDFADFFERNHLDGNTRASYAFGLFLDQKMICCLSIRTNHQGEREIARLATDYDFHVHGGVSKLLNAVLAEEPKIVTFSNNRLSEGDVYSKLGFSLVQENEPSYWYTDGKQRVWRYRCKRINDPEFLKNFPEVPHTEKDQAEAGLLSIGIWGDRRKLWKIEDYGHRKWSLEP